jgi:hypothetical protein
MALTATVDNANARVDLFVDWTAEPGAQTIGTITRRVGDVNAPDEYVRGSFGAPLLGEQAYVSDHEAPLDRPLWYFATANNTTTFFQVGPVTIDSSGFVWLKDPGRPWADLRLDLCSSPTVSQAADSCGPEDIELSWVGFGDKIRAMDAGLFDVLDRERPTDVYARRKDITTSMSFLSRTIPSIQSVYELFTAGGPLLVQVPAVYGMQRTEGFVLEDRYFQPHDLAEEYLSQDQRKPWRLWQAPLTSVENPVGEPQGTDTANWCAIEDEYATFADLTATGYSWGQVAEGDAATPPAAGLYGGGGYGDGPYGG